MFTLFFSQILRSALAVPFRFVTTSAPLFEKELLEIPNAIIPFGAPIPEAKRFFVELPSIHSSNFFESLLDIIIQLFKSHPKGKFNLMIEAILPNGNKRTVGCSWIADSLPTLEQLKNLFTEVIENFEEQSGTGEESGFTEASLLRVYNISSSPEPQAIPFSSSTANVDWIKETKAAAKAAKRSSTLMATRELQQQVDSRFQELNTSINTGINRLVQVMEKNPIRTANVVEQPSVPTTPLGIDWTPIVKGLVTGVAQSFGASVSFPSSVAPSPGEVQVAQQPTTSLNKLEERLNKIENKYTSLESLLTKLTEAQQSTNNQLSNLTSNLNTLAEGQTQLQQALTILIQAQTKNNNNDSNGGGSSSAPNSPIVPTPKNSPQRNNLAEQLKVITSTYLEKEEQIKLQDQNKLNPSTPDIKPQYHEIESLKPAVKVKNLKEQIVTADLEAIVDPNTGNQLIYMAAWYNGTTNKILDISQFEYNTTIMLERFWQDLIAQNKGRICYFHNWGGYDSILSMAPLFNLEGYVFEPMINNGEVMCLNIIKRKVSWEGEEKLEKILTIKDSIRILPGALSKLAKDWKVDTLKDHFPHYFFLEDVKSTINYVGQIPPYSCFEKKRTSLKEYEEMYTNNWSFLEKSKTYILRDVKSLYQIMIAFFEALISKFPIDPLTVVSAPSAAFKIWRTVQLPKLNEELLRVYDFSHKEVDTKIRESYLGGIVDVYRPHLIGEGYYYDVNSLYPTAMSKPMPVGEPTKLESLSIEEFQEGFFFGFVQATVKAPHSSTHAGYIGLLAIKLKGRLVCPGGTFTGLFFSEELYFALNNGYTLLEIKLAYSFQRGANTFKQLIMQLNEMKIQAQKEGKPTIRNIAKLLMNSMYGRFGMKTLNQAFAITDSQGLETLMRDYHILDEKYLGKKILVTYTVKSTLPLVGQIKPTGLKATLEGLPGNTNVAIASAVTAYSRTIINGFKLEALKLGLNIYYSDTDSLVLNGPLPEELIDSATLGKLKLEYKFKEGIFVSPKVYCLELEDGELITKCKGYSEKLSKEQYLQLLEGTPLDVTVTKWTRSLRDSTIHVKPNSKYTINPILNKRNKFIKNGVWEDTLPIIFDKADLEKEIKSKS